MGVIKSSNLSYPFFIFMNHTTWIELNRSHLEYNVAQYSNWLPKGTLVSPVIKANAYGHGLYEIASMHEQNPLIKRLCVIDTKEALTLRKSGITKPILVLGYINSSFDDIVRNNIDLSVYDMQTINHLHQTARKHNRVINVHLKVDTGMSRLGVFPQECTTYMQYIKSLSGLYLQGIWSHLSSGNNPAIVQQQENIFKAIKHQLTETHLSNSHGSLQIQKNYSFARIGSGLYGYLLTENKKLQAKLKPVLSLKSKIIFIKNLPPHSHIGYQQLYTTTTSTTIAILGIGYHDGINSKLIRGGKVIIHGHYAPILSINMNMTTVDISHIPQSQVGDTVILLGQELNAQITAYDWQKLLNLNLRESLAKLDSSIPRFIM